MNDRKPSAALIIAVFVGFMLVCLGLTRLFLMF